MENLKDHIEERLWEYIKRNYNSESYTNAILDAIQFLGDLIREKSGLEGDGNSLIGQALGGTNPKIKINKLRSESEKNVQKGVQSLLHGVYSAFRNPRSHSKYHDNEEEAFEIIVFLNHLLKLIDKSKGKFTVKSFLERVFDEGFVQKQEYADLLVNEIPKGRVLEVTIEIIRKNESIEINNLMYLWNSIKSKINETEKKEILELASDELKYTNSLDSIVRYVALFKKEWDEIDKDSRLRAENKLINELPNAEKDKNNRLNKYGYYAKWLTQIFDSISLRNELAETIFNNLQIDDMDKHRFIVDYYHDNLEELEKNTLFIPSLTEILREGLNNGNPVIYEFVINGLSEEKRKELQEEIDNFQEKDDELPF